MEGKASVMFDCQQSKATEDWVVFVSLLSLSYNPVARNEIKSHRSGHSSGRVGLNYPIVVTG